MNRFVMESKLIIQPKYVRIAIGCNRADCYVAVRATNVDGVPSKVRKVDRGKPIDQALVTLLRLIIFRLH